MLRYVANQSAPGALLLDGNGDAVTTGTTTVYVTIDNGTQTIGTGSVVHEGNGQWSYAPTKDETNGDLIIFLFTNPAAISVQFNVYTEASAIIPGSLGTIVPGATTVTGYQIINSALKEINVLGSEQSCGASMAEHGRLRLNRLLDLWKTRRLFVRSITSTEYTITTSKQSYTIGPSSADFTAARPVKIEQANLVRVSTIPYYHQPLAVVEIEEYSQIPYPTESAEEPTHLYYQLTIPNATLWPWPYPTTVTNKIELFTWAQIDVITNLTTEFCLAEGYEEAITMTLAEMLCVPYEKQISEGLARFARQARAAITSINSKPAKISTRDYGVPQSESY
jgi:hypothetical protein